MTDSIDDAVARVAALVAAAEDAVQALDTDPADGWGMLAAERFEVVELVEQLRQQSLTSASTAGRSADLPDVDAREPARLYEAAAAAAAGVDVGDASGDLLAALVQALTNAAATVRMVRRDASSL